MQLLPLLLVAIVMVVDGGLKPAGAGWHLGSVTVASLALVPVLAVVALAMLGVAGCERQLALGKVPGPIIAAERIVRSARWLIVGNHAAAVLIFGWLGAVRSFTGDVILLDELIAILPPILGLIGTWWVQYPIERRVREAMLIRRLDEGFPIYPIPTRGAYLWLQIQMNLLLMLVPILCIMTLSETIEKLAWRFAPLESASWISNTGALVAAASVFILAPLLARVLLSVQPLAPGPLREGLLDVGRRHRVRIAQLLLWNTNGSVVNAAVMGLIGPLRHVLITDALLDTLREDQVQAVMAHEVGHVRRHHLLWLIGCLMASFVLAAFMIGLPLHGVEIMGWVRSQATYDVLQTISAIGQFTVGLLVFGWICRRFERQADTFAVQHLSGLGSNSEMKGTSVAPESAADRITPQAVDSMCGALHSIARLNTIELRRRSWRHGSIAWRMEYLFSLVGRPIANLPIDRLVRWIKAAVAVVLIGTLGLAAFDHFWNSDSGALVEQQP